MSAKETVQQGLDARKEVRAAEAEAEKNRQELEEAGHELLREQIAHTTEKNRWRQERATLLELLARECDKHRELAAEVEAVARREKQRKETAVLVEAAKTVAACILLVFGRDFGWINTWAANVLLAGALAYLVYAVIVLARKKKH